MKTTRGRTGAGPGMVAAVLLAAAAPATAQNQIVNPGFDADLSGRTIIPSPEHTVSHDPVMGASAPGSARLDVASAGPLNHLVLQQCVTAVAGSTLVFMLITSASAGTSVAWYDDAYFGLNPIPVELMGFTVD